MDFFISEHLHRALCAPVRGKPERMCNCGMSSEHLVGTSIPRFTFDTPTRPGNDFYALCEGEQPLVMIFLPAFDHPVTREYLTHYLKTCARLRGVRLACVVRSSARTVAQATQGAEFPFPIICDAPGCCAVELSGRWSRRPSASIKTELELCPPAHLQDCSNSAGYRSAGGQLHPEIARIFHPGRRWMVGDPHLGPGLVRPKTDRCLHKSSHPRPAGGLHRHPGDRPGGHVIWPPGERKVPGPSCSDETRLESCRTLSGGRTTTNKDRNGHPSVFAADAFAFQRPRPVAPRPPRLSLNGHFLFHNASSLPKACAKCLVYFHDS